MEWSKLKNIIILILLLVNLFLLAMVGVQERGSAQYREQALADAVAVLERNGIDLTEESLPEEMELDSMTVQRDRETEGVLANALLGECTALDLGGGRYSYEGTLGTAEFRSNGNFSVVLSGGVPIVSGVGTEAWHAMETAAAIGLDGILAEQAPSEDGGLDVTLYQTWQGIPVYSCRIVMHYREGVLYSISGLRLMGEPTPTAVGAEKITVPTALIRTLNGISDLGDICSEITQMTPGYQMTNTTDGARMEPVWHIVTDTGAYQLNALTGQLNRA